MTELVLPARLTLTDATAAARELGARAKQGASASVGMVFDGSQLQAFDSAAFAVMLDVMRTAGTAGRKVTVRGAPPSMAALARLYGIDELVEFVAG